MSRMLDSFAPRVGLAFSLALACAAIVRAQDAKPLPAERKERPEAAPLHIEKLPEQLEKILKEWELASGKIQKLQGKHQRFVYEDVFKVEKRSDGIFYYESPDKGRIDIAPAKIEKGDVSKRKDPETKQPYKLQPDRPERWVCNGKEVVQFNDAEKTYELFPIPPQHQGANIMEGPLPFLFGMPADKAKKRFALTLLRQDDNHIWLKAIPRWKSDASNYKEAYIILEKGRYLPTAVRLIDPSGNLETVYAFSELKVNKSDIFTIFGKKPFEPSRIGYKQTSSEVVGPIPGKGTIPGIPELPGDLKREALEPPKLQSNPTGGPMVPSVVGFYWENAKIVLEKSGYIVKFKRGQPAAADKLVYVVYDQSPKARSPLAAGETVFITLYDKQAVAGGDKPTEKK